jgi:hypothetical protein
VIPILEAGTEAIRLEEGKEAEGTAGAFLVEGMVVLLGASWVLGIQEAWGIQGEAGPEETRAYHQGKGEREVVQGTHLEGAVLLGRMEVLRGACQEGATCPMEVASQMEQGGQHRSVARHHKHLQYSHPSQEP